MFTAIVLLWLGVSIASSTTADRQSVTHECPSTPAVVSVSSSLSRLTADRRLLSMAGRAFKPRTHRSPPAALVALLLLLGGVESNPGPAAAVCGLLNARSVVNKAAVIHDVIADNKLAVLALTETWVTSDAPDAIKLDIAPPGFQVLHQPRGSSTDKRGGGVAIIHRDDISVRQLDVGTPTEFEVLATRLTLRPTDHVTVVCVYRPPGAVTRLFCDQLADILDQLVTAKQRFVVCGDFNCPGSGDRQAQRDANLDDLLHSYDLMQHVQDTTRGSNTLDLLLTSACDTGLLSRVSSVQPTCFSDHA